MRFRMMQAEPHPSPILRAPVAVRTVDVDRPGDIELARPGVPYRTALIVALADDRPVGELFLDVDGVDRISGKRLRELIDGERWARPVAIPAIEHMADVSVVVTTCAQPGSVIAAVESVLACDPPPLEVIVVENRPARSSVRAALVDRFAADERIRYVEEPRPGLSAARNTGLSAATGELVAFTDDDVEVDRGWVGWIARTFAADPTIGCVTGLILPFDLETHEQVLFEQFAGFGKGFERRVFHLSEPTSPLFPFTAGEFGSGASTAVRVELLRRLGGFDAALGTGTAARGAEDLDLYIRVLLAGHALAYEPAAILRHKHPDGHRQFRRRLLSYGISISAMLTKYALRGYGTAIARRAPAATRYLHEPGSRKNIRKGPEYRRHLDWIEAAGMAVGPLAYGLSRARERRDLYPATGTVPTKQGPTWVGQMDVTEPVPALSPPRTPAGGYYERAHLLARHGSVPLGFVDVALHDGTAPASLAGGEGARQLPLASGPGPPAPSHLSAPLPSISAVICTRDHPDMMRKAIASVLAADYGGLELMVVDNAPATTATEDLVAEIADPRVRYVVEPVPGLSRARNRGLAEAAGEIIAFTDDDVEVDVGWLRGIVRGFRRCAGVVCVTGPVLPAQLDTPAQAYFDTRVKWPTSFIPLLFDLGEHRTSDPLFPYRAGNLGAGANFAVLTAAATEIGGFDEALGPGSPTLGGEDLDFFARVILAGHTLAFEPSAFVWHSHGSDLETVRGQMFAYRRGLAAYALKHMTTRPAVRGIVAATMSRNGAPADAPDPRQLTPPIPGMLLSEIAGFAGAPAAYLRGTRAARRHPRIAERSTE